MRWQDRALSQFKLYAVTDLTRPSDLILSVIESLYKNGVDIVQLRSKALSMREKIALGRAIRKISIRMKKLFFVNDSLDLALLTNADGLHVGQDDMAPKDIQAICKKLNRPLFLGLSTHSESQARQALKEPIDYFGVGPVFKTPTKPEYASVGLKLVMQVSKFATKPWVAIGGINESNLDRVLDAGAARVAVVRAIFDAKNPSLVCRSLVTQMNSKMIGVKNV